MMVLYMIDDPSLNQCVSGESARAKREEEHMRKEHHEEREKEEEEADKA